MSPRWSFALMLAASVGVAQAGEIVAFDPSCDVIRLESDVDRARVDLDRAQWELRQARNVARLSDERYTDFQGRSWSNSNDAAAVSGALRDLQVRIDDLSARLQRASDDAARFDADAQAARQAADAAQAKRDDARKALQSAYDAATAEFERRDDVAALQAQVNEQQENLTAAEKLATENFEATPAFNEARAKADGLRQAVAALRDKTPSADPQSIQSVEDALTDAERAMDRLRDEALAADPAVQAARQAMADVAAPLEALRREFERQAAERPEIADAQKDVDAADAATRDAMAAARSADEAALAARENSRALADELDDCRNRSELADADLRRAQGDSSFISFRLRELDDRRSRDWSCVRAAERRYHEARRIFAEAKERCETGRRVVIVERREPRVHFASRPPVEVPVAAAPAVASDLPVRPPYAAGPREGVKQRQAILRRQWLESQSKPPTTTTRDDVQGRRQVELEQLAAKREAEKKESDAKKLIERQAKDVAQAQKEEAQQRRAGAVAARRESEKKEADARRAAAALADAQKSQAKTAEREQARKDADAARQAQAAAREASRQENAQRQAAREAERQASRQRDADAQARRAEANRQEQAARDAQRQQQQQQNQNQNQQNQGDSRNKRR